MVAYSPLGHSPKEILGDPELVSIAKAAGKTPSQVSLLKQWCACARPKTDRGYLETCWSQALQHQLLDVHAAWAMQLVVDMIESSKLASVIAGDSLVSGSHQGHLSALLKAICPSTWSNAVTCIGLSKPHFTVQSKQLAEQKCV